MLIYTISIFIMIIGWLVRTDTNPRRSTANLSNTHLLVMAPSSWLQKRLGLLNHSQMDPNSALLIRNTRKIHTVGMAMNIDALFLDKNYRVLGLASNVPPGRRSVVGPKGTKHVLEMAGGQSSGNWEGEAIEWKS